MSNSGLSGQLDGVGREPFATPWGGASFPTDWFDTGSLPDTRANCKYLSQEIRFTSGNVRHPMQKVLITGGTGFVGRAVVSLLLKRGFDLRVLTRRLSLGRVPIHANCEPYSGNPLDAGDVRAALRTCTAVVHMVGIRRRDGRATGLGYDDVDTASAIVMADAAREIGIDRIVLLSAAAIGHSTYVCAKARTEQAIVNSGCSWTIVRPAFIVGPGQQWPRLLTPLLTPLSFIPGRLGKIARRAGNTTHREVAEAIAWGLWSPAAINTILEVPDIRAVAAGPQHATRFASEEIT